MCGGGQDALLGLHGIVGGLDGDKIVPVGGDIPEGVGLRCVEMVLQHQRQPLALGLEGGLDEEVALLDGLEDIGGACAIKRHAKRLYAPIGRGEMGGEKLHGAILAGKVHGLRIANIGENGLLQLGREPVEAGDEIGVDLTTKVLQLRIGGKQGVEAFHKLGLAHIKGARKLKEVDVLLHGNGKLARARIGRGHEERHGRCASHHLVATDEEVQSVHAVEIERFLVLLQEHGYGVAKQLVLWVAGQHLEGGHLAPFHHMQRGRQLGQVEEELRHVERIAHQLLVHQLAIEARIHRQPTERVLHQVHLGEGRRDGRTRLH